MYALVTGATGYIGVHVCRALLAAGWTVSALVRPTSVRDRLDPRITCHTTDDLAAAFNAKAPDAVIHLASYVTAEHGGKISEQIVTDNILLGVRLLEAMVATPCRRFIAAASYWEYAEDGSYSPNTLYAASKRAFADLLTWYARQYGISAALLILFDVYGPDDWRGKLLPSLVRLADKDAQPMALTPGTQSLDFVHVTDVAAAFVQSLAVLPLPAESPAIWSVETGRRMTLRDMVGILSGLALKVLPVSWGQKDWPPHQIMRPLAAGAFPAPPKWKANIDLEQGLAQLLGKCIPSPDSFSG